MDSENVMSWLEGLAEPDWRDFHSDSEVQNIAKSALELLKAQRETIDELISADKALKLMKEQETSNLYKCPNCGTWVSAENVVRCKDCVFGKREKNDSTGMTWIYCGHHRENRPEDWFCASGSRI